MANGMAVAAGLPCRQSIFGVDRLYNQGSLLGILAMGGPSKRRRLRRPRRWSPCLGIGVLNGPSVEIFAPLPLDLCTSTVCTPTVWSHFQHYSLWSHFQGLHAVILWDQQLGVMSKT
eukprot:scaffold3059_cov131-Amphora_coffeaeformis.AAC.8